MTGFDKSPASFPVKERFLFLAHCAVSPLLPAAFAREQSLAEAHMKTGAVVMETYPDVLDGLRGAASALLETAPGNLAFVKNTSEAMSMIAGGYPFEPGDRILSYVHEYPANHYPWRLQERRDVALDLLESRDLTGVAGTRPGAFTAADVEKALTDRTRIVAVSHVQFTSGFAADLEALGALCRDRGVDLVVDAAQSLGALPVRPEAWGIAAIAASGWKWLLGPVGTGLMYTAPAFREKLGQTAAGAELMVQGSAYLDHTWAPHETAKRFEYATSPVTLAAALETCIRELPLRHGVRAIRDEILRLQDAFLEVLDRKRFPPALFPEKNRSGILALVCDEKPAPLLEALRERGVVCSARGGYLRVAPHVYLTEEEMRKGAETLNAVPAVK